MSSTSFVRNTTLFGLAYVALMIPTYVLPWLGSNSAVFNAIGSTVGRGMTPLWWAHAWCLFMMGLVAHIRGKIIGKQYLPFFPLLAAIFDLTPGLNLIPCAPTLLHLVTIILGVKVDDKLTIQDATETSRKVGVIAGVATLGAVFGSLNFIDNSTKSLSEFANKPSITTKVLAAKETSPISSSVPPPIKSNEIPPTSQKNAALITHANSNKDKNATVKHKHTNALRGESNPAKDVSEVRYININE